MRGQSPAAPPSIPSTDASTEDDEDSTGANFTPPPLSPGQGDVDVGSSSSSSPTTSSSESDPDRQKAPASPDVAKQLLRIEHSARGDYLTGLEGDPEASVEAAPEAAGTLQHAASMGALNAQAAQAVSSGANPGGAPSPRGSTMAELERKLDELFPYYGDGQTITVTDFVELLADLGVKVDAEELTTHVVDPDLVTLQEAIEVLQKLGSQSGYMDNALRAATISIVHLSPWAYFTMKITCGSQPHTHYKVKWSELEPRPRTQLLTAIVMALTFAVTLITLTEALLWRDYAIQPEERYSRAALRVAVSHINAVEMARKISPGGPPARPRWHGARCWAPARASATTRTARGCISARPSLLVASRALAVPPTRVASKRWRGRFERWPLRLLAARSTSASQRSSAPLAPRRPLLRPCATAGQTFESWTSLAPCGPWGAVGARACGPAAPWPRRRVSLLPGPPGARWFSWTTQ
jgi:hypothetical protein